MKKTFTFISLAILIGGAAFYGGMKYAQNKTPQGLSQEDSQNFSNLTPEERQQRIQQLGASGTGFRSGRPGGRQGGNFSAGEIIAKDDKSITVKLRDGGSKIVFYSDSTEIGKFISGTVKDLEIGMTVTVNGKASQDGSIGAQSIQIRPKTN